MAPQIPVKQKFLLSSDYQHFIASIKQSVLQARYTAIRRVNSELISLYFSIGQQIVKKQKETNWGDDLIGQIEFDLKNTFPDLHGFSRRNLNYMRSFYNLANDNIKVQQLAAQIPWGHIIVILTQVKNFNEAKFYIQKTIESSWSRVILSHQISLDLYHRQGKLLNNFDKTIANTDIKLIKESFKENHILDFLGLNQDISEYELEKSLIQNITNLILELGKGFAFVGKQYKLIVGGQEFFIDLLFYNYILKRFVIIELKNTEFKADYLGQIGFYITTIDRDIKQKEDKSTIGLIICQVKNNMVVEYALASIHQPVGVAEYKLSKLPANLAKYLPNRDEINIALNKQFDKLS